MYNRRRKSLRFFPDGTITKLNGVFIVPGPALFLNQDTIQPSMVTTLWTQLDAILENRY